MNRSAVFLAILLLGTANIWAEDEKCLECHSLSAEGKEDSGPIIDPSELHGSVHANLKCTECHAIDAQIRHGGMTTVYCARCHLPEAESFSLSPHMQGRDRDFEKLPVCADCHGSHDILPVKHEKSRTNHRNSVSVCIACHEDQFLTETNPEMPAPSMIRSYTNSVHGRALLIDNNMAAPACVDCHGSHTTYPADDINSPVSKEHIAETCGACHKEIAQHYSASIHGRALANGVLESPTCTDCHGEHNIQPPEDPESSVYATNVSRTCSDCHASEKVVAKYGLKADRIGTFKSSFHGAASELGDTRVANCASCHGTHDIYPKNDTRSTIHEVNISSTCGKCHEDLPESFVQGAVHTSPASEESGGEYYVRKFYIWFIAIIVLGFILYRILEYRRQKREV